MWVGLVMAAGSGVVAALVLVLVLRNAVRFGLVQAPNARSSHVRPTPTGGGIGIVAGALFASLLLFLTGDTWPSAPILLAALLIAGLGLWDDIRPIPAALRLPVQLLVIGATIAIALPLPAVMTALAWTSPAALLFAVLLLGIGYWVNLFNFMDGIDGLAGSEAIFMLLAPLALALLTGPAETSLLFWWPLSVAVAVGVFLTVNWQPARIFMGDVGSTFLGFLIAIFGLLEIAAGWVSWWELLILAACFVTDGTVTIVRRALQRESIITAHRRHAYQWLARRFASHKRVVLGIGAINIVYLLPLAVTVHVDPALGPVLALAAYLPLVLLALVAGAGRPEHA